MPPHFRDEAWNAKRFGMRLPKDVILHIWTYESWKHDGTLADNDWNEPLEQGYNAIVNIDDTTGSHPRSISSKTWYLDKLQTQWWQVYRNDPCCGIVDGLCPMVLGGEGLMWGETTDASNVLQNLWPRLAAIGERLWSPREVNNTAQAHGRISEFRCLLIQRGVPAAPLYADGGKGPHDAGSCLHPLGGAFTEDEAAQRGY